MTEKKFRKRFSYPITDNEFYILIGISAAIAGIPSFLIISGIWVI